MTLLPPPAPGVAVAPFLDGLVAFVPRTQELHRLGGSSEVVWQACIDGLTVEDLVAEVVEATGLDSAAVEGDVQSFVAELREKGLAEAPPTFDPTAGGSGRQPGPGIDGAPAGGEEGPGGGEEADGAPVGDPSGGWARSRALAVLDDRVVVRAEDRSLVEEVEAGFGTVAHAHVPTREYAVTRAGDGSLRLEDLAGRSPARAVRDGQLLAAVVAETNQLAAASASLLALHAGGVRPPDQEEVVVLAAPSGSGKSTLTAALLGRGWDYLSDEAIGVRPGSLAAVPYPKPLSLGPVSRQALGVQAATGIVTLERVAAGCRAVVDEAGPVSAVVLPRFEAGAEASIEWLESEDALFALAENAFNLAAAGQAALDTLIEMAIRVPVVRLVHGGAPSAADAVAEVLEQARAAGAVRA